MQLVEGNAAACSTLAQVVNKMRRLWEGKEFVLDSVALMACGIAFASCGQSACRSAEGLAWGAAAKQDKPCCSLWMARACCLCAGCLLLP